MSDSSLDEIAIEVDFKAKDASSGINSLTTAMSGLNDILKTTNSRLSRCSTNLGKIATVSKTLPVTELNASMSSFKKTVDNMTTSIAGLSGQINKLPKNMSKTKKVIEQSSNIKAPTFPKSVNFMAQAYLVRRVGEAFGYTIKKANDYIETLNLFSVAMGDAGPQAMSFIKELEGLGINMEQAMRYQASFHDLAKSLGMSSKNAYTLSEQFTKLAYDYSSLYNINPDVAFQKLQAAAVGTVEPIRRLGKDISIAKLQEIALTLGIQENVRTMSQAERATLRFIAVMQQSGTALNDLERTINSPANQLRVLRAQFNALVREIGGLVIPALNAILPVLIAIAQAIRAVIGAIASLFGAELPAYSADLGVSTGGIASNINDAAGGAGDLGSGLGGAADKAKKLKDYMLGIDELNVLKEPEPTGGGGGGGGGGLGGGLGGDLGLDLSKFGYAEVLKDVENKAKKIYEWFARWKRTLTTIGVILAGLWAAGKIYNFIQALKGVGEASKLVMGMRGIGGLVKAFAGLAGTGGILGTAATAFQTLGAAILSAFGISAAPAIAVAVGLAAALAAIVAVAMAVDTAMQPAIKQIDVFGYGVSEVTKNKLEPFINKMNSLDQDIKELDWADKVLNDEQFAKVQEKTVQLREMILNELSADRNQELADLDSLKGVEGVTAEELQKMKDDVNSYYDDKVKRANEVQKEMEDIIAKSKLAPLEEQDLEKLAALQEEYNQLAVTSMSESAQEQELIMQRLTYNKRALAVEEGSEILKTAKENHDQQIQEADDLKARMMANLDQRYSTEEAKRSDAYKKEKAAIEKHYDEQKEDADKLWADIKKSTEEGLGEESKYIDTETGEIKTRWSVFWDNLGEKTAKAWNRLCDDTHKGIDKIKRGIDKKNEEIKKNWNEFWDGLKINLQHVVDDVNTWMGKVKKKVDGWFTDIRTAWDNFWDNLKPKQPSGGKPPKKPKNTKSMPAPASVAAFARGGFVKPGSRYLPPNLFTAGEAGQELIGKYKSKRTVMPLENTSFVNAVHEAVYSATVEAMDRQQPVTVHVQPQVKIGNRDIKQAEETYEYDTGSALIKRR